MAEKGDLVIVVGSCCKGTDSLLGHILTVEANAGTEMRVCSYCARYHLDEFVSLSPAAPYAYLDLPKSWLKKIPPLSELEGTEEREVIRV